MKWKMNIGHTEFKETEIGRIPAKWSVAELKNFLSLVTYGFTNPMPTVDVGPFMITATDISEGQIDFTSARRTTKDAYDQLTDKSRPEIGDVLITKDGTLGRTAVVERSNLCINQSVALLRPNETIRPQYLSYLLSADKYQAKILNDAGGSTIKHIYITVIDRMIIAVPSIFEQEKILGQLNALKNHKSQLERRHKSLCLLKNSLMQDLLTGKVRVTVN